MSNSTSSARRHLLAMYRMVLSDGHVDTSELAYLSQLSSKYGVTQEELKDLLFSPSSNLSGGDIPEELNTCIEYLYELTKMAWADGEIEESERKFLEKMTLRYGFLEENVSGIVDFLIEAARVHTPLEEILQALG